MMLIKAATRLKKRENQTREVRKIKETIVNQKKQLLAESKEQRLTSRWKSPTITLLGKGSMKRSKQRKLQIKQ